MGRHISSRRDTRLWLIHEDERRPATAPVKNMANMRTQGTRSPVRYVPPSLPFTPPSRPSSLATCYLLSFSTSSPPSRLIHLTNKSVTSPLRQGLDLTAPSLPPSLPPSLQVDRLLHALPPPFRSPVKAWASSEQLARPVLSSSSSFTPSSSSENGGRQDHVPPPAMHADTPSLPLPHPSPLQ
jgi:hypothetical protein